jgi:hypothetical protein
MKNYPNKIKIGILKALCYSEIFDYPLTASEVYKYFVGSKTTHDIVSSTLYEMRKKGEIGYGQGFYFLRGKEELVNTRILREIEGERKIKYAEKIIKVISFVPTIKLISLSGSLSMRNAKREDDIDIFVITKSNSLWLTRLVVNLILMITKSKRDKLVTYGIDKICPNMFVTISSMKFAKNDRNIFSAHEISQMVPVVNKDKSYERFIEANFWIANYLPHAISRPEIVAPTELKILGLAAIDRMCFLFQHIYMKDRITSEKVGIDMARFHPKDKTFYVNFLYREKYQNLVKFVKSNRPNHRQTRLPSASKDTPGY